MEVISALAATSTSPVSVSTMRAAVRRPDQRLGAHRDLLDAGLDQLLDDLALSTLPAWHEGSRWRGGLTSSATLAPTWASGWSFTHALPSSKPSTSSMS